MTYPCLLGRTDDVPTNLHVSRRAVMVAWGLGALPAWSQVRARQPTVRIGWLAFRDAIFKEPYMQAFVDRLREHGLIEGINLVLDRRHVDGAVDRFDTVAAEIIQAHPDLVFSSGGEAALAALKKASTATPVVYVAVDFDPVQAGYFSSIARPEGMLTGISANQSLLPAKRLELLTTLLPKVKRVSVFSNPQSHGQLEVVQAAARRLGLDLVVHAFGALPYDYEAAFANVVRARSEALLVLGSSLFVSARQKIPQLAAAHRLPSVFHHAQWTEAGGLMSYGYNFPKLWQMGADMVVKVANGVPVAELPIEFPTSFELAINATTARLLGVNISYEMKLRTDRFIT